MTEKQKATHGKFKGFMKEHWTWNYIFLGFAVSIKRIFTDYEIDIEYAVSMSYRQVVNGDLMVTQMWESHQTLAFCAALFCGCITLYSEP